MNGQMPSGQPIMAGQPSGGGGNGVWDARQKINALQQQISQMQSQGAPPSVLANYQRLMQQAQFELQQQQAGAQQQLMRAQQDQNSMRASGGGVGNSSQRAYNPTQDNDQLSMQILAGGLGLGGGGGRTPGW